MSAHNQAIQLVNNFRKDLRRKDLEKSFANNRKLVQKQQQAKEQALFNQIYPQINEENFPDHLEFVLNCCFNQRYNFMMIPFTGYIYDFVLNNPKRQQGYRILETLTQFQEIQVPQTEQFVQILLQNLPQRGKQILNIIANLLDYPRYSQVLRDYLIQANFISRCESYLYNFPEKQTYNESYKYNVYLYFTICCDFIKSHPAINLQILEEVIIRMSHYIIDSEEVFTLCQSLQEISTSFNENQQMAQLLLNNFQAVITQHYFHCQDNIVRFALFCIKSKVYLKMDFLKLLVASLENRNQKIVLTVLNIFQTFILWHGQALKNELYHDLKDIKLFSKIYSIYLISEFPIKQKCLDIVKVLARCIVQDKDIQLNINLCNIINDGIDNHTEKLLLKLLDALVVIMKTLDDNQLTESETLVNFFKNSGVIQKIIELKQNQLNEFKTKLETILYFYDNLDN